MFAADIKGDLSGIAAAGEAKDAFVSRAKDIGYTYEPDRFPAMFWDVFGEQGHPVRATVSEMCPLLLSRMMDLNDVQEGVLNIAFRVADEQGLRQIFRNLFENSLRYTPKGGVISVTIEAEPGHFRVRVKDSGAGIPSKSLPRIFERFYRGEDARAVARGGGAGLGLGNLLERAERHDGHFTLAAGESGGSVATWAVRLL